MQPDGSLDSVPQDAAWRLSHFSMVNQPCPSHRKIRVSQQTYVSVAEA